jgi:hypothetical protein
MFTEMVNVTEFMIEHSIIPKEELQTSTSITIIKGITSVLTRTRPTVIVIQTKISN